MKAGWTGTFERLDAYLAKRVRLVFTRHRNSNITKECSMQVNPYLTFNGNCEEAFKAYQGILGGDIVAMIPHEGTPAEGHVPAQWLKKILHARLVGNGMVLMGSDAPPERYQPMQGFSVNLSFKKSRGGRARLQRARRQGNRTHGAQRDLLGHEIRHADGQIRHAVDDQLREGARAS